MPSISDTISSIPCESPTRAGSHIENLLLSAGIRLNGPNPWDIQLRKSVTLERILSRGTLGLGEAYMNGDWDVENLDEFFFRVLRARLDRTVKPIGLLLQLARERIFNRQNLSRAWQVGEAHYDLGNDFYAGMLDPGMAYTCGYWKNATTLAEAQTAKYDLICRKLALKPGMKLLDIGCGWGGFMAHAAENHQVSCVGVTISKEQAKYRNIDTDGLRDNLGHFLSEVIPTAEACDVRMAAHPDDPPFSILGLPRIVSTEDDLRKLLDLVPSSANGLCFCAGSLGARVDNDLPGIVRRLGESIHAVHLRSVQHEPCGAFHEARHLEGCVPMAKVVNALLDLNRGRPAERRLSFRPDHGHRILDDLKKPENPNPGYDYLGRMRGLAELRGLQQGLDFHHA